MAASSQCSPLPTIVVPPTRQPASSSTIGRSGPFVWTPHSSTHCECDYTTQHVTPFIILLCPPHIYCYRLLQCIIISVYMYIHVHVCTHILYMTAIFSSLQCQFSLVYYIIVYSGPLFFDNLFECVTSCIFIKDTVSSKN